MTAGNGTERERLLGFNANGTSKQHERLPGFAADAPPSERRCPSHVKCTDESSRFQLPSIQCLPRHAIDIDIDRDAIHFGVRMAVCLTASSLFVLAQEPGDDDSGRFPEGMWVLITVLFVCWFPTLDAASVLEKSVQRLWGTMIGACLGLACGFLSLEVEKKCGVRGQALCLACCIAVVSFVVCSYAVNTRVGQAKLIERKNYATILCLLTFTICLMPFYSMDQGHWRKSLYRVMNVVIGCILGVGLSMVVFPRPTVNILQEKICKQVELAGEASEAVLHTAADIFAEETYVPLALAEEILSPSKSSPTSQRGSLRMRTPSFRRKWRADSLHSDYGHDYVLEKYEAAAKGWRAAKSQLGVLKYDPFNIGRPNDLLESFRNEVAQTLARAMRIQTTVVLIDGIVRNDPKHKFSGEHLDLVANVGTLIRSMLSVPLDVISSDAAAMQLSMKLVALRRLIVEVSATVSTAAELQIPSIVAQNGLGNGTIRRSSVDLASLYLVDGDLDDKGGTGAPKHVQGSYVCSLLFLQLVEHLALRSLRLYQSWKQYDGVCQTAENLRASVLGRTESSDE